MQRVAGLTSAGKPVTRLFHEVHGVTEVVCEGRVLQEVWRYHLKADEITGKPEYFFVAGNNLHLWPVPDQTYKLTISWDGHISPEAVCAFSSVWVAEYHIELARAKESA